MDKENKENVENKENKEAKETPLFNDEVLTLYNNIELKYPSFIDKAKDILASDIDSVSDVKNYLDGLYTFDISLYKKFDKCWEQAFKKNDSSIVIKIAIESILAYINIKYGYIGNEKFEYDIKKFLLSKKRDLKKDVKADTNKFKKNVSEEKLITWLDNKEKLILTEFALFDRIPSNKKKIVLVSKTLEYLICIVGNDGSVKSPIGIFNFPIQKYVTSYPLVEISDDNDKMYDFFYKISDPENPNHIIKIIVGKAPALKEQKIDSKTGTLTIKEGDSVTREMLEIMKSYAPTRDDQDICTFIYNLNNYYFNEKGFIDFYLDDIANKLVSSDDKYVYQKKSILRNKIINTINKMSVIKMAEYFEDEEGRRSIPDFHRSFIFTEAYWIDEEGEIVDYESIVKGKREKTTLRARVYLAKYAKDAFAKQLHNKVLGQDYLNIDNEIARHILFLLQEKRVESRNDEYNVIIPLMDFRKVCTSYGQMTEQYLRSILEKAFKELERKGIIISLSKKTSSGYYFKFIELSDREREMYGLQNESKPQKEQDKDK